MKLGRQNHYPQIFQFLLICVLTLSYIFACPTPGKATTTDMYIVVDATELPRKLLHSQITFNVPGNSAMLYPKWWFGHHGPVGAIGNVAGLTFTAVNGQKIEWERDWQDIFRFILADNVGNSPIQANLTYICNQPTANTKGCDSYGYPQIGIINWNTITLYPEGVPVCDITVQVKLILPEGWQYGTALPFDHADGETLIFKPVTLEELIDMPLICGTNFRTVKYASTKMADYYLHIAADDADFLPKNDSTFVAFTRLADEAETMFGRTHFKDYHFLLTVSDLLPLIGLEHRNSSLNGVKGNAFKNPSEYNFFLRYVMTHEFVHAWCGKYRRPAGMNTPDYQRNKNMELLWVYEGLTQYLGFVLMNRSGFISFDDYLDQLSLMWGGRENQKGRRWRSLRDTQVANYTIRARSDSWGYLRRNQDFYSEGAIIWMEFDARIRNATYGKKSLDDFCAKFFSSGDPTIHAVSFDLTEILTLLDELADQPWAKLIDQKINQTEEEFDPVGMALIGYQCIYTDQKSDYQKQMESERSQQRYQKSVGMAVNEDGIIGNVVPGSPADQAGLYDGVIVVGVNGKTFSYKLFENAVRNTSTSGNLTLLTLEADTFFEYKIDYNGGLRYSKLVPVDGKRDWLKEIMAPKVSE